MAGKYKQPPTESNADLINLQTLLMEVRELRQRLDDGPIDQTPLTELTPVIIKKYPARTKGKRKATKFSKYSGDRTIYPAWGRAFLSALKMDWNTFEYTDSYVFLKIYEALEGKAQKQAAAYFESGGLRGEESPENFIAFLDRSNWDPTRITRAKGELNGIKMGPKQRWSTFFPMWTNKLTEAKGDVWRDETKITMLEGTLNHTLLVALASNHLFPSDDYFEWVRIVTHIAQKHDDLLDSPSVGRFSANGSLGTVNRPANGDSRIEVRALGSRGRTGPGDERRLIGDVDSSGDTIMGRIYSAEVLRGPNGKPLRAKWKPREAIENLRKEGRCYRCVRKGCNTRICRLLPAVKPGFKSPAVNLSTFQELNPSLYEEVNDEELENQIVSEN